MALSTTIVNQIRDEIGPDNDFGDDTGDNGRLGDLEDIYLDVNRGNLSTLRTAYLCWKIRLGDHQSRAFDATAGGSLMARTQRTRFLERRVKEMELLIDTTDRSTNWTVNSDYETAVAAGGTEFS